MKVEQIYTGCLAEAAYYIESNGEAAIIDPLRETQPYIDRAARNGATIKYILETHFHADFVSGHQELAAKTGATIVFGPTATPGYDAHVAQDGEVLKLGNVTIKVLHTPGHTMESATYLLQDENGKDHAIFTGDTLFIGDVGRPDLVQKLKAEITPELLAGLLYDSLRQKIMPLADDIIIYPGHGAGSACGKHMSKETTDTLRNQKTFNYALRTDMTRDEFIKEVTTGLVAPPQYFPYNVLMNVQGGMPDIEEVIKRGTMPLPPAEFQLVWDHEEALVIDTRRKEAYANSFIPGSIFIGLDDNFAPWVGTLVSNLRQPILLVADEDRVEEAVVRLSRVGYDNSIGYLKGGICAWKEAGYRTDSVEEVSPDVFASLYRVDKQINLLDVRRESEYRTQHLEGAVSFPLDFINQHMSELDKSKEYYLHCAGGYRSLITASILQSRGYNRIVNIKDGFKGLVGTGLPLTAFEEQRSML
ncbi:MBL fold metallo-hydrolase [Paraflavitalea soli]|uniref:MBL fold metallo-hydrolase n=1 Tax=Paraflavitalea soli TaxID=2315862 RepID=A0A3B7ML83_9BACT|nr:MBL fold metallo-hydrolase [Paraflavitalea soli]AXY74043.1 MBL fold metallo-hydrolase [Paraflavitalea soli]